MLPAPFRYPLRGERGVDTVLIGGGLHLLAVYVPVLPLIVVLGYLLVVFRETSRRADRQRYDALPPFRDVLATTRAGVGGAVVVVAYLLPAAVTLLVTVAGLSQTSIDPQNISVGTSVGFVAGSTASLLLAVVFLYLLPAALANYLARGRIRGAFDHEVLLRAASDGAYFYDVLVGLVAGGLLLVVARATTAYAIGFFVAFYAELVVVGFWSRAVSRALPSVTAANTDDATDTNDTDGADDGA
ncbi:DUF4013 domain-containing protein [Halobacterium bonnevillei]|nr:DUF4013 domain-containing protein [Halobacterium bonnevillei]